MDFKEQAKRLTERIFSLSGSNAANEAEALIFQALQSAFNAGATGMAKAFVELQNAPLL